MRPRYFLDYFFWLFYSRRGRKADPFYSTRWFRAPLAPVWWVTERRREKWDCLISCSGWFISGRGVYIYLEPQIGPSRLRAVTPDCVKIVNYQDSSLWEVVFLFWFLGGWVLRSIRCRYLFFCLRRLRFLEIQHLLLSLSLRWETRYLGEAADFIFFWSAEQ